MNFYGGEPQKQFLFLEQKLFKKLLQSPKYFGLWLAAEVKTLINQTKTKSQLIKTNLDILLKYIGVGFLYFKAFKEKIKIF